jgi:hypothetical protein
VSSFASSRNNVVSLLSHRRHLHLFVVLKEATSASQRAPFLQSQPAAGPFFKFESSIIYGFYYICPLCSVSKIPKLSSNFDDEALPSSQSSSSLWGAPCRKREQQGKQKQCEPGTAALPILRWSLKSHSIRCNAAAAKRTMATMFTAEHRLKGEAGNLRGLLLLLPNSPWSEETMTMTIRPTIKRTFKP